MTEELFTIGRRLTMHANAQGDRAAIIFVREGGGHETLTYAALDSAANRLAHRLVAAGVDCGRFVAIHLPNSIEHVVASIATLKAGGCAMPVSYRMPPAERDQMFALGKPVVTISDDVALEAIRSAEVMAPGDFPDTPPPDRVSDPLKAIGSGGSTGRSKLIVSAGRGEYPATGIVLARVMDLKPADTLFAPGPLYHNQAFFSVLCMLFEGGTTILNERFRAASCLRTIEELKPTVASLVPTMMLRMIRDPDFATRDLSSLRAIWHMAAPCAEWVKQGWIDRIGADKVWELWGATELTGLTIINGEEWLKKRGSVGRGFQTEFIIVGEDGKQLAPGNVGEIFSRLGGAPPNYAYVGSDAAPALDGGFVSVGDLGHVDEDGYLFLADRRVDMVISGGANVFPAEVEAVISEHPAVRDVAVVGLQDEDLGRRVHAIIESADAAHPADQGELMALVGERLARYKVPRTWEFVDSLPRDDAGKIRRRALRDARDP